MVLYKRKVLNFNFPVKALKHLLKAKPQYGSNQAGIERTSINQARYIRITDIDEYGLLKNDLGVTAECVEEKYLLNNNDILFARSGATVGKTYLHKSHIVGYECFYAGYMIRFLVDEHLLKPEFLFYYTQLNTYKEWIKAIQRAAAQPNINAEEYKSLQIPVPPLDIQVRIVAIFNDAYAEKRAKENEAAALLSSIDGYLLDALGICPPPPTERKRFFYTSAKKVSGGRFDPFYHQDEFEELEKMLCKKFIVKFDSLIKVITKGETPLWKGENYVENGIPFLKVQNISVDGIIGELNYIEERLHHKMLRSKLKGGELLYTMAGSIGIATILPTNFGEANINQAIAKIILRSDIEINHYYLVSVVNSTICRKQAQRFLTVSAQPNINFEQIKQIRIPLPPIAVQTEIADHIAALRARARQLTREASEIVEHAKRQVEQMILGAA